MLTVDEDAVVLKNLDAMFEDNRLKPWRQLHQQRLYVTQAVTRNHAMPSEQIYEKLWGTIESWRGAAQLLGTVTVG